MGDERKERDARGGDAPQAGQMIAVALEPVIRQAAVEVLQALYPNAPQLRESSQHRPVASQ